MLHQLLGSKFWDGVKNYLQKYKFKTASSNDFRNELESASKYNLVKFFDQWVYGEGYPQLEAKWEWDHSRLVIEFTQRQKQQVFDLELPVVIYDDRGNKYSTTAKFVGRAGMAVVHLEPDSFPAIVEIDPECHILFTLVFNPGTHVLFKTATESKSVRNRIRSFWMLLVGSVPSMGDLRRVCDMMANEPFFGIRVEGIFIINSSCEILGEVSEPSGIEVPSQNGEQRRRSTGYAAYNFCLRESPV